MSSRKVKNVGLADLIRQVRESRGLSQAEFATLIQRSRDSVQSYELGRSTPKAMPLSRILRLAPASLVEPIRKHLLPMASQLAEDAMVDRETPELQFRDQALRLMRTRLDDLREELRGVRDRNPPAGRISGETAAALHAGLDLILERAPSTAIEEVAAVITRFAGRFSEVPAGTEKKTTR